MSTRELTCIGCPVGCYIINIVFLYKLSKRLLIKLKGVYKLWLSM